MGRLESKCGRWLSMALILGGEIANAEARGGV